ncbi:MAG: FtsX-like permease family protein [Bacillota bacterium]|jgi:ABC-type antimicrobial peptide transport system permease subunit|nr:FtsX-like permease family protein [Bacillota bacterium]HHU43527.1 FtsX-like permease family protein [Clostridiales bacterium]
MKILINHTLKSIKDNRAQIAIIITTVAVVTVMIFVALSLTGLFYNINIKAQSRLAGDAHIAMRGDEIFPLAKVKSFQEKHSYEIEYIDTYLQTIGLVETYEQSKVVMLEATDLKTLYERYPHKLLTKEAVKNYEYPRVWVSESFAKSMDLKAGDTIEIYSEISDSFLKMSVARIMYNQGIFADSSIHNILVDIKSIPSRGMINTALIRLKDPKDFEKISQDLKEHMQNDAIEIQPAVDVEYVQRIVRNNTNLLNIAVAFIMTIMILILFTSYLVVAKRRINEMVIFKASGATPSQTAFIMLFEVLLYGFVGATIGLLIGRAGMGIVTRVLLPNFPGAVSYDLWKYAVAFLTGVLVFAASSIFSILQISKKSIRQLTSGVIKDVKYAKPIIIIVLSLLLGLSLAALIVYNFYVVYLTIAVIILFAFWIYFVTPYVIKIFSRIFSFFKGQSQLAGISIKRNSAANTLTILVGAAITFSFIVVSVIGLIVIAIKPYNSRFDADFAISSAGKMEYQNLIEDIRSLEEVESVFYCMTVGYEEEIKGNDVSYSLIGISDADGFSEILGLTKEDIELISQTQHPIIINYDLAQRFNWKIGDKITLQREKSTATTTYDEILDHEFVVCAIDYTQTEYDRVAYVLLEDMTYNGKIIQGDEEIILVNAKKDADMFFAYLSLRDEIFDYHNTFVIRFEDWAYAASQGLSGVSILLRLVQILVSLVAFIGIVNLTLAAAADRKRELTVYKASGMSVKKYNNLAVFESLIIGFSGSFIGIGLSFFFNRLMPTFALIINKYYIYPIFPLEIIFISLGAILVYLAVYFLIALLNRKNFLALNYYNDRNL